MSWAPPIRGEQFRTAADKPGDNKMRSIVLHFEPGTTNVDGFACSACDWFHVFTTSEPDGTLPRAEVDLAHERYASHVCADYSKVGTLTDVP